MNPWIYWPFALMVVLLIFKFIMDTIDDYLGNSLVYFAKIFHMSEALAGVTLIAFANGAGDIVTSIVSSE